MKLRGLKQVRAPGLRNLHLELVLAAGDAGDAGDAGAGAGDAAHFVVQHISSLEAIDSFRFDGLSTCQYLSVPGSTSPLGLFRFSGLVAEGPKPLRPQSGFVQWHPQSPEPSPVSFVSPVKQSPVLFLKSPTGRQMFPNCMVSKTLQIFLNSISALLRT